MCTSFLFCVILSTRAIPLIKEGWYPYGDRVTRLLVRLGLRKGPNRRTGLEGLAELTVVDETTKLLYAELQARLERLQAEGFVDLKVFCGRESSVRDKLWALNNVLRLSEEGKTEVTVLEG